MIDLSQLPAPDIVEVIDFEQLLATRKARLIAAVPETQRDAIASTLELDSEPLTILLQESAYTELILRQRINEAARATMLAYASGTDLDNRAADYDVQRLLITPADPNAMPPVEAVWESDDRLRYRCQMALEGLSVAGSRGAYVFHTLSASPLVADVAVDSPQPGEVRVTILTTNQQPANAALLNSVTAYLSADERRPLTDHVTVQSAELIDFTINATLLVYPGPSSEPVLAAAHTALDKYLISVSHIGYDVTLSGLYAALHQSGVQRVQLHAPLNDVVINTTSAARCTDITLTVGTADV